MENQEMDHAQKKKTSNDFIKLLIASIGLIVGLLLLKYAMGALGVM